MANYYVSTKRGSDATGTGTAANPWKTIGKAIGASPAITLPSSGSTRLYIEPGTYYEAVTLGLSPSAVAPLEIVGDCDGAGYLAGGWTNPRTGIVDWSAWTDDATAISSPCLNGSSRSFVAVRRIKMHGGSTGANGSCLHITTGTDWAVTDCILAGHQASLATIYAATAGAGLNLTVDRCDLHSGAQYGAMGVRISTAETAAEYDLGTTVRNCRFFGSGAAANRAVKLDRIAATGLGFLGRGLTIRSCTFLGFTAGVVVYEGVTIPLANPCQVVGCFFVRCANGIQIGAVSQAVEDWNVFHCSTPRTTIAVGANSNTTARPAVDLGDGRLVGVPLRPFGEPTAGSPLGGIVPAAAGFPTADLLNRARPEGFGSLNAAAGCLERHDAGELDSINADLGSPGCLALRGPGSLDRPILVDPTATVVRVKVRWDGAHGDSRKPRAILLANPEIGLVADQVVTATSTGGSGSTPNAYETLTFAAFTPSRAGVVMLRMVSRPEAATGTAYFDSITLS
ncbi:hypothetical protein [Planctomyces sp. SH-PL62]|uniref:hypothetical protein n=1 Tax=Planctomyces sp. SH-PL62 TaxID=1636152 RepID=UPI00078BD19E|nr:hypothetical protein [Planctomyces sp. SH-PL62]AMV37362.1 hypothetical protein VT85_08005 [Planctomyces sp. SH-PL62]